MHQWKSVNKKKMVLIKKRTFFVQNVSVDTWIAILSKLSKNCHKTFKQELLQTRIWEKITKFPKAVFSQELCTSGQLNCGFEHLTITFLPIFRNKHLHKPKKNMISLKWIFLQWKFSSGDLGSFFKKSGRKLFARSSKKVL